MATVRWSRSLVVRLTLIVGVGGVALAAALGWAEYRHARQVEACAAARQLSRSIADARPAVARAINHDDRHGALDLLHDLAAEPSVAAARLVRSGWSAMAAGAWQSFREPSALADGSPVPSRYNSVDLVDAFVHRTPSLVRVPVGEDGEAMVLLLTDGRRVRELALGRALRNAGMSWAMLGGLVLIGLGLLHLWLTRPLRNLIHLAASDADAERFVLAAARTGGELGVLAGTIGGMLRRLDGARRQLAERETEIRDLYQHAPMAILTASVEGVVEDGNDRAAAMFAAPDPGGLERMNLLDASHPGDRAALRARLADPEAGPAHQTLRIQVAGRTREYDAHFMSVHRAGRPVRSVRITFADATEARRISDAARQRQRLLERVIDGLGDAMLIANPEGRILAVNTALERLLGIGAAQLVGQPHEPAALWTPIEPLDAHSFEHGVEEAARLVDRPFEQRVQCAVGAYRFQARPVTDDAGELLGQLWVVTDESDAVQSRRMLDQREAQLKALRRFGRQLHSAAGVDDLLERSARALREVIDVEAAGVAVRGGPNDPRCRLLIDDGQACVPLAPARSARKAVAEDLMPRVLAATDSSFWPDLTAAGEWARPLTRVGLESLAAAPLLAGGEAQGIAWLARRGGERLEPHQLHLLEAVAPILSTALLNAALREALAEAAMTDPLTDLPSFARFEVLANRLAARGEPWALLAIDIDRFGDLNELLGVAAANQTLRAVGDLLRSICRSNDQPIRHSADTFLVVCPRSTIEEALALAERIRRTVGCQPHGITGDAVEITCSIGVAAGRGRQTRQTLLAEAQARLRAAQATGRDRVVGDDGEGVGAAG